MRGAALALIALAGAGFAFTFVGYNSSWWTATFSILASTNSSVPSGAQAQAQFHLTNVKTYNDLSTTSTSTITTNYADISGFDTSYVEDMRIIQFTMFCAAGVAVAYGVLNLINPLLFCKVRFLFAFLLIGNVGLAVTNLVLTSQIPKTAEYVVFSSNFVSFTCGMTSFTWSGLTFQGQQLNCGDLWKRLQYSLVTSDSTTASAQYKTNPGNGWWWTLGAGAACLLAAIACASITPIRDPRAVPEDSKPLPQESIVNDDERDAVDNSVELQEEPEVA